MRMFLVDDCTIKKQNGDILIENLTFQVNPHDRIAIIGEEGNGKSTLIKLIYEDLSDLFTVEYKRIIRQEKMAILYQEMDPIWNDSNCIEYCLKNNPNEEIDIEKYNELEKVEKYWLRLKGAVSFLYRDETISTFSGGEKVKIQLLKLLLQEPTMILLDEPSNDLDLNTIEWLEDFILSFEGGCCFISHDEYLLKRCANKIIHLELVNRKTKSKATFYTGDYKSYVTQRSAGIEKMEAIAQNEKLAYRKKMNRVNDIQNAVHSAQNSVSRQAPQAAANLKKKMHSVLSMKERIEKEGFSTVDTYEEAIDVRFEDSYLPSKKRIVELVNKTVRIDDNILAENVNFELFGQDHIAIIGANGTGKTTLMKQILESVQNTTGIKVGYMPQNYYEKMDLNKTPLDFLEIALTSEDKQQSYDLLGCMNFTSEEMNHKLKDLSDGQKAKCFFIRFIKDKCNVLLLDEPTRNLSPLSQPVIHRLINDFEGCVCCITHDRSLLDNCFETVYRLENKQLSKIKDTI